MFSCCSPAALAPLGEVILVVDTDAPLALVTTLRIDIYSEEGKWLESREFNRIDAHSWPTSFSVFSPEPGQERRALVRLRVFPSGRVRDYRGERFEPAPLGRAPGELVPPAPPTDGPRILRADGRDGTPRYEPQPTATIDRLLAVRVPASHKHGARVVLRGSCFGTMADLLGRATCVDREGRREPVVQAQLQDHPLPDAPSELGTFGAAGPCTAPRREASLDARGRPLFDEEVCVPGGAFLFGDIANGGSATGFDGHPERVVVLPSFRMDRYEFTVGRALLSTRSRRAVGVNSGPVRPLKSTEKSFIPMCTANPDRSRDKYPVNCVPWETARLFCKEDWGGDLPTEAEWEYAALVSGRARKSRYVWGGDDGARIPCETSVHGRDGGACEDLGFGPEPVDSEANSADATPGLGIIGLGGSLIEYVQDDARSLSSACWLSAPLFRPSCTGDDKARVMTRGGGWDLSELNIAPSFRRGFLRLPNAASNVSAPLHSVGFRCVRPGSEGP